MYIPDHFSVSDENEIFRFIKSNSFGQLISNVDDRLFSSHIPFILNHDNTRLLGHLAKNNPQWCDIENQEILVTFQGPHDYISPSWMQKPAVPTWNYQAVHVYGKAKVIADRENIKSIIENLTHFYESSFEQPWKPKYKESITEFIIGIEIEISEIQCKYKLSQNRPKPDRQQIIDALKSNGSNILAKAMEEIN